jgi:phosphoesterase RecJ-like protein
MDNFKELQKEFANPKKIVITTHLLPDADALGSSLAIYQFLVKLGHEVQVITPTDYPDFLRWMPFEKNVKVYTEDQNGNDAIINTADFIFCLDFSGKNRIGDEMSAVVFSSPSKKILIDHHLDAEQFADYQLWVDTASSTCELVYDFIKMFDDPKLLDIATGECIYAGMMTDTGSFRYPSTSKHVHLIVADLMDIGVVHSKIHQLVYDNNTQSRLRLLGYALSEKMTIVDEYHTAFIALSKEELERFHAKPGDTEGIVNYALSLKGIVFAALIKESDDFIKMSFRSKGDFPANKFSKEHFNGGGHKNAAGGRCDLPFEETIAKFKEELKKFIVELKETRKNAHE